MSFSVAALLTALPVVTMGGLALAGSWLHQHVSERRSVAISLLLIAVGALMRELYPQSALLLSSALLGGVGIGIIQAVMPSVIKRRFQQRTPLVMGLWSAALMGGGGLGAAITPWLVQHSETGIKHSPGGRCLPLLRSLPGGGKAPARSPLPTRQQPLRFAWYSLPARGRWVFTSV